MPVVAQPVGPEALLSPQVTEHDEQFAVVRRRDAEQQHGLVQSADLGARRVATRGPGVRLALDQHLRVVAAEIEAVEFLTA